VTRSGIPGYHPEWLDGRNAVTATHGQRLAALPGRKLKTVELLDWWPPRRPAAASSGAVDVGFDLSPGWLTVFNALDENGIRHEPPGAECRRYKIEG